jgi:hypothetical protein
MLTVQGNARGAAARAPRTSPVELSRWSRFEVANVKVLDERECASRAAARGVVAGTHQDGSLPVRSAIPATFHVHAPAVELPCAPSRSRSRRPRS